MTDPAPIGADAQTVDATLPEMDALDPSVLAAPAADGMPRREGPPRRPTASRSTWPGASWSWPRTRRRPTSCCST